jgi:macrolide-specific efflux system membrane fusion protein
MEKVQAFILVMGLALTIALPGCNLFPKEEDSLAPPLVKPQKQTYETAKVERGSIEKTVSGTGTFVSAQVYPIYFTQDGTRIKQILVRAGDTVKKGQLLVTSETANLDSQLQIEKYNMQLKQLDLDQANQGKDPIAKERAKIYLEIEQQQLDMLDKQLAQSQLVSPISGVVTSITDEIGAGQTVGAYQTILNIGDTSKLSIGFDTVKSGSLALGMKTDINYNGVAYTGSVAMLPGEKSSSSATTSDSNTSSGGSNVGIRLDKPIIGAKIGDSAQIDVVIARRDNTLVIPLRAVIQFSTSCSVYVWDGTTKKQYDIKTGLESDTDVEVLSGLKEGQNVILN